MLLINCWRRQHFLPYSIASAQQRLALKSYEWICAVHPKLSNFSNIIRLICMQYATLYSHLDEKSPILFVSLQKQKHRQPLQIELKPPTKNINYTCVRYDETTQKWINDGIELLDSNRDDFVVCKTLLTGRFSVLPVIISLTFFAHS
ncbi:unnamed protein product [Enterobius vermicularis]|uniref:Uncharacterized protein n=1 Tax=Enterobius vermicularis TaxID=51028 RepID=A0A0N4UWK9_ENTVE|nr:unnamed protein product [Enterobius vermicularis]